MPAYLDTSALVKRYVAETGSAWVRRLLAHPAQYVIYTAALAQADAKDAWRWPRRSAWASASPPILPNGTR